MGKSSLRVPTEGRFNTTDLGNAERLVARHGDDLRFVADARRWLVWDGKRFARDADLEVERLAKATIRAIWQEADRASDEATRSALMCHAQRSEGAARIRAMIDLTRSDRTIAVRSEVLDVDPMVLNVANGTIDLRTGALRPHDRADLLTQLAPVDYDPDASAPLWSSLMRTITAGDPDHEGFLRRAAGYSLTARTDEQVLLIAHGSGANAKSVTAQALREMLGDYGAQVQLSSLRPDRGGPRNDLARLAGIRLAVASEADEYTVVSEAAIKQITGGDRITTRLLYREFFEHLPSYKLVITTNRLPHIAGTSDATWRRILVVPFPVTIPPADRDPGFARKLRAEFPGILAWSVRGCVEWQRRGLDPPPIVLTASAQYRSDMDMVGRFLEERCVLGEAYSCRGADLYEALRAWCSSAGERVVSQKDLGAELTRRGFGRARVGSPTKYWTWFGLGLRGSLAPSAGISA